MQGRALRVSRKNHPRCACGIFPESLAQSGTGSIVNIGSVVGFSPEFGISLYGATKAYVLCLSQGLAHELSPKGVYVQAVLPATTRTEIWAHAGVDVNTLPEVMEVASWWMPHWSGSIAASW